MDPDALYRMLSGLGKQVLLRRMTGGGAYTEVKCYARLMTAQEGAESQTQQDGGVGTVDRRLIISNKEIVAEAWPAPPMRGDVVVMLGDGWTGMVQACATSELPGTGTCRYDLTLSGSG